MEEGKGPLRTRSMSRVILGCAYQPAATDPVSM